MNQFDFLKNHVFFQFQIPVFGICNRYSFQSIDGTGTIFIPFDVDELGWSFSVTHSEDIIVNNRIVGMGGKTTQITDLHSTPLWFQELLKKSHKELNKRDKLRKIFK